MIGESPSGIPIYTFTYKNGFSPFGENDETIYVGVIAQDIIDDYPQAVTLQSNGFYAVNYAMIDVDFAKYSVTDNTGSILQKQNINEHHTLEVNNSVIRNNTAGFSGQGIYNACGHVKINQSTISGNTGNEGGGIFINKGIFIGGVNKSTLTEIDNSTIVANVAGIAGGVYLSNDDVNFTPELIVRNTTITENNGDFGFVTIGGNVSIYNTVISDNVGPFDQCIFMDVNTDPTVLSNSAGNASSDASCGAGFISNVVSGLNPLADNGGVNLIGPNSLLGNVLTMLIDATSALFDTGDATQCLATDQIGTTRPQGAGCDIGAFEAITNTAPVITSDGGGSTASISLAENITIATTVTSTDLEDDAVPTPLTYSITGGADQALFTIDATTGVLSFITAPDFESPTDSGNDNVYDLFVTVTDSGALIDAQEIAITITDVNENSSSSHGGGSSINYVCKDETASNYSAFGRHKQSKCDYDEEVVEVTETEEVEETPAVEEPSMCPIFTQHMRKGDRDGKTGQDKQESGISSMINEIKLLQTKLKSLGFNAGPLDGIFGTQTENGVRDFQQAHFTQVLAPWGLTHTTGRFYQSSERWMNEVLGCHDTVTIDKGVYLDSVKG